MTRAAALLLTGSLVSLPALAQSAGGAGASSEGRRAQSELLAAAQASPRPSECAPMVVRPGARVGAWDRARRPAEQAFCDALARGYAALSRSPATALEAARQAERAMPGKSATLVLEARALLAAGSTSSAFSAFERARGKDRRSVEAPDAMHDFAVAALTSGRTPSALAIYRALVPRASLLPDVHRRQRVLVEAGLTVMSEGPKGLDEALGYLSEARRQRGVPGLNSVVLGALALALDRQGRSDEARGVIGEAGAPLGPVALASAKDAAKRVAAPGRELHAVAALLVEQSHREIAESEWETYLAGDAGQSGVWAAHARRRLEALRASGRGGRRGARR